MFDKLNSDDWREAFGEGSALSRLCEVADDGGNAEDPEPFKREDVVEILAITEKPVDYYADWDGLLICRLRDGRYALVSGYCDATGWGCRDDAWRTAAKSLKALVRFGMTDEERVLFWEALTQ